MDVYIGFDSAWTDNQKAPGAICALCIEDGLAVRFHEPRLVSFDQALVFIKQLCSEGEFLLVALDQPTVVPNLKSMRPVERVAASLISWLGGGVQPANRGRLGMFCDASPIWRFLNALEPVQNPELARIATDGIYLMEVFPALALASLEVAFFRRLGGPRYNPGRKKTFKLCDWVSVTSAAARECSALGFEDLSKWCLMMGQNVQPKKSDQDKMDSVLCLLTALRWRLCSRDQSILLGDLATGYMVVPASPKVRDYLSLPARKCSVAIDGVVHSL